MSTDKRSAAAAKAYAVFNEAIADPDRRRALANDPEGTLREAGVNARELPPQVRRLLDDLSYEELRLLSRYNVALEKSGLLEEQRSATGLATICKF